MATIKPESLERLRQRVDLIDVLSSHMELKPAGAVYKGLCPFHDEKTPSFMVRRGDTHYHCFGCGAHGDAIAFLMNFLRMNFIEAVEHLAQRFAVLLEREEGGNVQSGQRKALKQVLERAAKLYHYLLLYTQEGQEALQYLYERGLTLDFVRRFELGYAPRDQVALKALREEGHSLDLLRSAGLVAQAKEREFFAQRILFPVCDAVGQVIGFSGRKFHEQTFGGKYINTPETLLFHKSRLLFGLHHSRRNMAKRRQAILVEGQIDCLRLIDAGIEGVVAPLGTAFGSGHVEVIKDLGVNLVTLAFDGDQAGRKAAAKAGQQLQKVGIGVKVALFPEGSDPDSLLNQEGPKGVRDILERGVEYLSFLCDHKGEGVDRQSPAGKSELIRELSAQVNEWEDPVMVHEGLRRLAHLMQVPQQMVGMGALPRPQLFVRRSSSAAGTTVDPDYVIEADVMRWLLLKGEEDPAFCLMARHYLPPDSLRSPTLKKLFQLYLEAFEKEKPRDLLALAAQLEEEEQETLNHILDMKINRERAADLFPKAVQRVMERNWMDQRETISQKIQSGAVAEEETLDLARQFDALNKQPPEVAWEHI